MNYIEVNFTITPYEEYIADILINDLAEIGFESFSPAEIGLNAYIVEEMYNEDTLKELIRNFPFENTIEYTVETIPQINWNEEWEKNYFKPIIIGNECIIHSSFHKDIPSARYNIIIDPKMSFGTGHHETTSLMIEEILKMELEGKTVLDMGCGTSVLSILASMRKASEITAIDIDPWCVENSKENLELNNIHNILILEGGAEKLIGMKYDIILANINRNILLNDMAQYSQCLSGNGELYMSGFYVEDIAVIQLEAEKHGLVLEYFKQKNNWALVKTVKK